MQVRDLRYLYDRDYAAAYNDAYLLHNDYRDFTEYEVSCIRGFLKPTSRWLDVACGTGYFLSRFQHIEHRVGLDLSPAMLAAAQRSNPDINLYEWDFRKDVGQWHGKWDLVSSLWCAYFYVDTVAEVDILIRNMAQWTSAQGTCFMPAFDADMLLTQPVPDNVPYGSDDGRLSVDGVICTWVAEPSGKRHVNLVVPRIAHMTEVFEEFFSEVTVLEYPKFQPDPRSGRKAIVAKGKRTTWKMSLQTQKLSG